MIFLIKYAIVARVISIYKIKMKPSYWRFLTLNKIILIIFDLKGLGGRN